MDRLREGLGEAWDLLGMLWYHGSFRLSFVTYALAAALGLGFLAGRFL